MTEDVSSTCQSDGFRNWFCLRSQPRHEHIAAAHLRKMNGVEVFLPRIRFRRVTSRGTSWVTEALFPGYLFARFDWQNALRQVHHARGVSGVVHFGERWPTIEESIVEELRRSIGTTELRVVPSQLLPGDEVTISSGAFRGLEAVVSRVMPGRARVAVLMEFLGRQSCIQLPEDGVIKNGDERSRIL